MNNAQDLIKHMIDRVCVPHHLKGSPTYGAIKYELAEYDLQVIAQRNWVPAGTLFNKFGFKIKHGACYTSYQVSLPEFLAQLDRLDTLSIHNGLYVYEHQLQHGKVHDRDVPDLLYWTGDLDQVQDVVTYLNLIA